MPKHAKTKAALAKAFDVSKPAISRWVKEPDFPGKTPAGWLISDVRRWRATRGSPPEKPAPISVSDRERLLRASADREEARAELAKIELGFEQGVYVRREQLIAENGRKFHAIRQALMTLSRSAAPALISISEPARIEAILEHRICQILERLCDDPASFLSQKKSSPSSLPAREGDSRERKNQTDDPTENPAD
jgi:transposase-like protein